MTPQRSAARERTATQDHRRACRPGACQPSTKCSSRTNCDPRSSPRARTAASPPQRSAARERTATRVYPTCGLSAVKADPQRSAARERTATRRGRTAWLVGPSPLNEVQLANELRPDAGADAARVRVPSTKCSSRTNCDLSVSVRGGRGPFVAPQRSAARERTATRLGAAQQLPVRRPSTKCSSRTNCDLVLVTSRLSTCPIPQRSAARERTATCRHGARLVARLVAPAPSTKCSSRTNCDQQQAEPDLGRIPIPLNEVQLANELRHPGGRLAPRLPTSLNEVQLANELRRGHWLFSHSAISGAPQRSAARERTATQTRIRLQEPGIPLNEVQLANELRPGHT